MKVIYLKCDGCGNVRKFRGEDAKEVCKAIDEAGWHDAPKTDWCPKCWDELPDDAIIE